MDKKGAICRFQYWRYTGGGTKVDTLFLNAGDKVTKPTPDPTKKDANFVGWYTSPSLTTTFDF